MTKLAFLFQLGAAGVLAVPALVGGGEEESAGLRSALARTIAALEELAGIESAAAEGALDVEHVLAATPAAPLGERERDERLAALRVEVSRLQELADERAAADLLAPPSHATSERGPAGLGDAERLTLASIAPPVPGESKTITKQRAFEQPGFSADPLRHGRAYFHAGRYEEAIKLFEALGEDPAGAYWIGRSLERLGQTARALEHYRRVAESDDAGDLKQRAAYDLEFLEWKVRFESRRAARGPAVGGVSE